jgi:hypothetical protein
MRDLIKKITAWYRGEYVPIEADLSEGIPIVSGGYYKQPPLAKALGLIGGWIVREWKWVVGTFLALLGLYGKFFL